MAPTRVDGARRLGGGVTPVGPLLSLPVCLCIRGVIASNRWYNLMFLRYPGRPKAANLAPPRVLERTSP